MFADILILGLLSSGPRHGYEIRQSVEARLGGLYQMTNSQLYPALRRFEEMGAVTREVVPQEGRPDRHLYRLTPVGLELLHDLIAEFPPDRAKREGEFYVRVAHFDRLTPPERLAVLRSRREVLLRRIRNVGRWVPEGGDGYLAALAALRSEMLDLERRHVDGWIEREGGTPEPPGEGSRA